MKKEYDLIIVGAGLSGCVIAERAATILNSKVLIVEKRSHIAGNCYDEYTSSGVLIHKYGPHYFRTNNLSLLKYLSSYTGWIEGNYIVKSKYKGELYAFPINIDTLEQFFNVKLDEKEAKKFLDEKCIFSANPANSEEFVLSRVGRELYEAFYLNYTIKQWKKHPRELDPSVCGRIPIRYNRDNRYVDHQYQLMPDNGYTAMIKKMIDHPNIHILLNTDYKDISVDGCKTIVYTGPVDEYFNYSCGKLAWRSLSFRYEELDCPLYQPCVQINYPNEHEYTRTVEIKHVTQQQHKKTVIAYEYPSDNGDPYYPVPSPEAGKQYAEYKALMDKEIQNKDIYFTGRLANYTYLNMDEVIEQALLTFEQIKSRHTSYHH